MLYRSIPVEHQPVANLGSGQWSTPYLSMKMYYILFSIRSMYTQLRSEARNYGLLSWIYFFSVIFLIFSNPLKLPFLVLLPKTWDFSYSTLLCISHDCMHRGPSGRKTEGEKNQWVFALPTTAFLPQPPMLGLLKAKITALLVFDMVSVYVNVIHKITQSFRQPQTLTTTIAWGKSARDQRTKTGKHGISLHLSVKSPFSLSLSQS